MTPEQIIKLDIFKTLLAGAAENPIEGYTYPAMVDSETIDEAWNALKATKKGSQWIYELQNDVRCSGTDTGLPSQFSRNYECREVAANIQGRWVGWTYWFGGGKHGQPEEIDWMDEAYFLDVEEERREVIVRTFVKPESKERGRPIMVMEEIE